MVQVALLYGAPCLEHVCCAQGVLMTNYACITGNWFTAGAHIITAVIGSGVLSLAWAISTMGWAAGPLILFLFAVITWYMSLLLADAYRDPRDTGKRNYTYPGAVSAILGGF